MIGLIYTYFFVSLIEHRASTSAKTSDNHKATEHFQYVGTKQKNY
jgi:hypothetical protein